MDEQVDVELARALFAERRHDVAALQALLAEARASRAQGGPGLPELLVARGVLDAEAVRARLVALGHASAAGDAPPPAPLGGAPERVGPYRLLERLGAGGMGAVFRAVHEATGVEVALKLVFGRGEAVLARFAREGTAQARVDGHPNVVRVHAAGVERGQAWLVMDLMPGGSLDVRLREGPLPAADAARIVADLARGLEHAHGRGVLHRDLKPHNVLFDAQGAPRLVDFGLARVEGEGTLTATGAILGTPAYMSPEQAAGHGHEVDARADVYGLGAILYHCLTGRPPFEDASGVGLLAKVLRQDPTPPRRLVPTIPPALEAVCLRALAKRPEDRQPTALALAEALDAPPPAPRRWPLRVAAGALVALVLAVAVVGAGAVSARRREAAARAAADVAAVISDEVGAALASDGALGDAAAAPAAWRARRDEALAGLVAAGAGPAPAALGRVDAQAAALEGLVAAAQGDLARAKRCLDEAAGDPEAGAALAWLDAAAGDGAASAGPATLDEGGADEFADGDDAAGAGASAPVEQASSTRPVVAVWTLALRGALDALAPDGDPVRGRRALDAARAGGLRRPELAGWQGRAAARGALLALRRGESEAALAHVVGATPPADLRDELIAQARANAQSHLAALAAAAAHARRESPALRRLDATLQLVLSLRPGAPVLEGEQAAVLERVAFDPYFPPVELAPRVADGAPDDLDLQGRVAEHCRRIAWPAVSPSRKPALADGYARAIERAVRAAAPGPERDELEVLLCEMLVRAHRDDEALPRVEALLARADVAPAVRANALLVRAFRKEARARPAAVLADLDAALALDPDLHRAHFERARARRDAGDHAGALDDALAFMLGVDGRVELLRIMYPWATAWAWSAAWRTSQVARMRAGLEAHVTAFPSAPYAGWRVRLAYSQLSGGDADAARATLAAALPLLRKQASLADVADEVERLLQGRGDAAAQRRALRSTVVNLDRLRRGRTLP